MSDTQVFHAGGRVAVNQRTVIHFGCRGNSTLVVPDLFWGVHREVRAATTYYLPGDCTSKYTISTTDDCSKSACIINTTTPVELPCLSSWRGSKAPQYLHINYFCMAGNGIAP